MSSLLQVQSLSKSFGRKSRLFGKNDVKAVQNVSFTLEKKQMLAIIGKNGSGKSTLAKMIVGITEPTSGNILFNGSSLVYGDYQRRANHIRMVFQDTNNAFNPRLNVGQTLDDPLRLLTTLNEKGRNERIFDTLYLVGLSAEHANIPIHTLTMSQKQRVALARAIILEPEIIIIDDAIGFLDASVKTQLTNLLLDLQERLGLSYIYVGQHLGIIKHCADQLLVMDNGEMIEYGSTREILTHPQNDITKRLIESYFGKLLTDSSWQNTQT
ncbi:peptide ABC transporter ATP-binding protein [Pasteurella bettyae]|uniref:Peptide transport system ATP-binding protein SapF n=1 Tax=Pasteurella bettyae CCUG 2042 TaxID=1095749 RepID=I3DEI4_9PAST|nr:ATP-binding cassette domain-containing protein [Pasteurella bettyae]EIJ70127.1 peptide transport system ATP-binding protein SapF [Pasteurella bettyae CCUG 2042]SUB21996.1 peptide transport system ATP-binding protein SapF [Pasteurella bettyae]